MDLMKTPTRSTSGHLPGFLLGDTEPLGFSESSRISLGVGTTSVSPKDVEMTIAGTSPQAFTPTRPNYGKGTKAAGTGPPTLSLFDEVNTLISETKENQPVEKSDILQQTNVLETVEGHWIMVYGFPPSTSAHVLSLFSQIGSVVESSFPTTGNWMFVKYSARSDARKALSYDARVINGNIMIGVREGKNINQMRSAYPSTPTLQTSSILNRTTGSPAGVLSPKIRSLGTPKRSLPVQQTLDTSASATPSSPSVVSKAMDLLFGGW